MEKGTVKWFNARKRYGFICGEDGVDYFVHYQNILEEGFRSLKKDQKVIFKIGEDESGRGMALEVKRE